MPLLLLLICGLSAEKHYHGQLLNGSLRPKPEMQWTMLILVYRTYSMKRIILSVRFRNVGSLSESCALGYYHSNIITLQIQIYLSRCSLVYNGRIHQTFSGHCYYN